METEEIWKRNDLLTLLHNVLENQDTKTKISTFSPNGEKYGYNQYSLFIVIDFFMKYQIIIKENNLLDYTLQKVAEEISNHQSHQELVIYLNNLLAELTQMKLGLPEKESPESKRRILQYIYEEYIVNGYCFHSFPSVFSSAILLHGIDPKEYRYPVYEMKQITHIFANHNCENIITKDLNQAPYLAITDSPAMAYFHAIKSPEYFANLTATGLYMKKEEFYDREAYYRKDKSACEKNLKTLCDQVRMSEKEKAAVQIAFEKQWDLLKASNSFPCVAYIPRKVLAKNFLEDIEEILEKSEQEDFALSIAKITDSRYSCIRRYDKIERNELTIHFMPAYRAIKQNVFIEPKKEDSQPLEKISSQEESKNENKGRENAYALCMFGLLLICIGFFIMLFQQLLGG